jgi:hypothetical protein
MGGHTSHIGEAIRSATRELMLVVIAVLWLTTPLWAQQDATELAKQTQNPVADLISLPFQHNFNFGAGTKDATIYVLNVQPVIPLMVVDLCAAALRGQAGAGSVVLVNDSCAPACPGR